MDNTGQRMRVQDIQTLCIHNKGEDDISDNE